MNNNNIREQKQHTLAGKQKIASFLENEAHVPLKIYKKRIKRRSTRTRLLF